LSALLEPILDSADAMGTVRRRRRRLHDREQHVGTLFRALT